MLDAASARTMHPTPAMHTMHLGNMLAMTYTALSPFVRPARFATEAGGDLLG
jgi:hypothetical protein